MNLEYTEQDIQSAIDFAKKNPDSQFKDWFSKYQKTISENDKKSFEQIEIAQIPIPNTKNSLYLLKWTGVGGGWFAKPFKLFLKKYFGKYHQFSLNSANGNWDETWLVTPDDDVFVFESYPESIEYKSLREIKFQINNSDVVIQNDWTISYFGSDDERRHFNSYHKDLERNCLHFWTDERWSVFINDYQKLDYKKALDLLK